MAASAAFLASSAVKPYSVMLVSSGRSPLTETVKSSICRKLSISRHDQLDGGRVFDRGLLELGQGLLAVARPSRPSRRRDRRPARRSRRCLRLRAAQRRSDPIRRGRFPLRRGRRRVAFEIVLPGDRHQHLVRVLERLFFGAAAAAASSVAAAGIDADQRIDAGALRLEEGEILRAGRQRHDAHAGRQHRCRTAPAASPGTAGCFISSGTSKSLSLVFLSADEPSRMIRGSPARSMMALATKGVSFGFAGSGLVASPAISVSCGRHVPENEIRCHRDRQHETSSCCAEYPSAEQTLLLFARLAQLPPEAGINLVYHPKYPPPPRSKKETSLADHCLADCVSFSGSRGARSSLRSLMRYSPGRRLFQEQRPSRHLLRVDLHEADRLVAALPA